MKSIAEDIKKNSFLPLYLLYGEEAYLRCQVRDRLLAALAPEADNMNVHRFTGKGIEEREIISLAETLPFLAERRVILIEDSGFFKNKTEELADYLAEVPEYLVLIFCETEVDKRSRMYKAVSGSGRAVEFARQSEAVLGKWVLQQITRDEKKITRQDMEYFLHLTGADMSNIRNELEKLLSYCADREVITRADIDAVVSPQLENRIFDMVRAVAAHRKKEAFALYHDLLSLKESPLRILYLLAREFNNLRRLSALRADGVSQGEMAKVVGMPPFAVKKNLELLRHYRAEELEELVEDFVRAETDVKTGKLEDQLAVELMLIRAC